MEQPGDQQVELGSRSEGLRDEGVAAGDGQRYIHSGTIAGKLNG